MMHLTQQYVREHYIYNETTGVVTERMSGREIGTWQHGYTRLTIRGKRIYRHQFAFLYMTGEIPALIDHRDQDMQNDVWANLRPSTKAQNSGNSKTPVTNRSGVKGVSFCRMTQRWRASIRINGREKNLGRYSTIEEAAGAYRVAAEQHFGEFASCQ